MTPDETRSVGSTEGWFEKEAERICHGVLEPAFEKDSYNVSADAFDDMYQGIKTALRAVHAWGFAEGIEKAANVSEDIASNYFQAYANAGYRGAGIAGSQAASAAATNIRALKK